MLEERSCLVSRRFSRNCDKENSWACMNYRIEKIEIQQGKRLLESDGDEEVGARKLPKQLDACENLNIALTSEELAMIPTDQSGNQRHAGDHSDTSSLIHAIEIQQGKRLLESDGDEEVGARKLPKQLDACENLNIALTSEELAMIPTDQSGNQRHAGDHSDTSSLIHAIGRDISISAFIRSSRSDYGSLASLNRSFRELIRSGELYRHRRQNGVIEHWVYFSCQLLGWEAFDPTSRRWMRLPTMTSDECFMFSDKESLAVGTELLVFGKVFSSLFIFRYSVLTNTWSSGMNMNFPRCLFGSASVGEIAILAGGCHLSVDALSYAELYNSELGAWETLPNMNKTRKMCSAVFMDGKFYVIGGIGGSELKLLTCGEEYNLQTRIWTEIPNMSPVRTRTDGETGVPVTAEAPPLVAVVDNELYAADYAEMEVRKYDKLRRIWETVGRLPERADSMNGWGLAFKACGHRLIVIGGPRAAGEGFIEINAWAPRDGPPQWNLLGRMQSGSFVYNCAVMGC